MCKEANLNNNFNFKAVPGTDIKISVGDLIFFLLTPPVNWWRQLKINFVLAIGH